MLATRVFFRAIVLTVYNLLHRHGWRKLMPRPFHPKRDFAQNAFKKTAFLML